MIGPDEVEAALRMRDVHLEAIADLERQLEVTETGRIRDRLVELRSDFRDLVGRLEAMLAPGAFN
jgi:hypothetical protein